MATIFEKTVKTANNLFQSWKIAITGQRNPQIAQFLQNMLLIYNRFYENYVT